MWFWRMVTIAYLDMSDSTVNCPNGFRLYEVNGMRACGRPSGGASCASVKFPSNSISYSEVCSRVVGYRFGSPDAVDIRFVGPEIYNNLLCRWCEYYSKFSL